LELLWSLVLGIWSLVPLLFSRIGFGNDDADGVLTEAFETAFALQIFEVAANRVLAGEFIRTASARGRPRLGSSQRR
jgi:hypothetical protein